MIPVLLFSVVAHEVAHGYVAYRYGDDTAKTAGRLTLNPIAHIDIFGTIVFPLILILTKSPILFGWAKPVPVNVALLRNPPKHHLYVSLAGIATNLLLAVGCTLLYGLSLVLFQSILTDPLRNPWLLLLNYGIAINVILAVFNLMPIPPLDGSWVLYRLLPQPLALQYQKIFPYGFFILILLLMTNTLFYIINPIRSFIYLILDAILKAIVF
jgi:Zn-dependent protease